MQRRASVISSPRSVLGIALAICLSGCASSPVSVANCSVREIHGNSVAFEANIVNHDKRIASKVYIIVATKGSATENSRKGTMAEYDATGPFTSGTSVHEVVVKSDPSDLDERLGPIFECYVHAVEFGDGSIWDGPSPS